MRSCPAPSSRRPWRRHVTLGLIFVALLLGDCFAAPTEASRRHSETQSTIKSSGKRVLSNRDQLLSSKGGGRREETFFKGIRHHSDSLAPIVRGQISSSSDAGFSLAAGDTRIASQSLSFLELGAAPILAGKEGSQTVHPKMKWLLGMPENEQDRWDIIKQKKVACLEKGQPEKCREYNFAVVDYKFEILASHIAAVMFCFALTGGLVAIIGGTQRHVRYGFFTFCWFVFLAYTAILYGYSIRIIFVIVVVWFFMDSVLPFLRFILFMIINIILKILEAILNFIIEYPIICIIIVVYILIVTGVLGSSSNGEEEKKE